MKIPCVAACFFFACKRGYLLVVMAWMVYLASCQKHPYMEEHPDFIDAVNKRMDTAKSENIDASFIFIDAAFARLKNPGAGDIFMKDSVKSIKYRIIKHDYARAISLLDGLLILIKGKTGDEKYAERYVTTLYQKGECLAAMKHYNEALYYYSQAEETALRIVKNRRNIIYFAESRAYLLFVQEKYLEAAAAFLKQSRLFLANCNYPDGQQIIILQRCQNNTALSYLRAGMPDSALFYQNIALTTIRENEYKYPADGIDFLFAKAVIYGDQAEICTLKGKYTEAENLYKMSIAGTGASDVSYTQQTMARLADVYLTHNKTDSAKMVIDQLKLSLDKLPGEKQLISWYKLSAKYYSQTKQVNRAFTYQQQYLAMRDFAETRDKKFASIDIAKEFENLELKYSNDILQKESTLKTTYLGIAVSIFVIIASVAVFTWYTLKKTQQLHRQLKHESNDIQIAFTSLEKSHEANNRIIRIVAHELKTPVSTINHLVFAILRKNLPEDLKEIFELIKKASSNSMVLINDALLQKKRAVTVRKELVDMKRLLEYCVDLLQAKAAEKNQQLNLRAEDVSAMLNRQKMWRVIGNIVNNAIKFSPAHTVIDIRLQKKGNCILLSVQDNGIGIPESLKEKIFTMSPEVSRKGTFGEESHGMGLSISRKLVEEHEGKIWFDSTAGDGSIFYVELPGLN